jgi:cobalt-precorrin 5A hydrolase/precorrin-3B C17-methyltransferase
MAVAVRRAGEGPAAKILVAGVGCSSGASAAEVIALVEATLAEAGYSPAALAAIATLDRRAEEPAVRAAAAHFGVPLRLFSAAQLAAEAPRLEVQSPRVRAAIGIPAVAEAAALKAGRLLVPKRRSPHATCAIGLLEVPYQRAEVNRPPQPGSDG